MLKGISKSIRRNQPKTGVHKGEYAQSIVMKERLFSRSNPNTYVSSQPLFNYSIRDTSERLNHGKHISLQQRFSSRAVPAWRNHGMKRADSNPDLIVRFPNTVRWLPPRSLTDFRSTVDLNAKNRGAVAMVGCSGYRTHKRLFGGRWNFNDINSLRT